MRKAIAAFLVLFAILTIVTGPKRCEGGTCPR